MAQTLLKQNIAILNFRPEELQRFVQNLVDFGGLELESLRANGPEELGNDVVESRYLAARDIHGFLECGADLRGNFSQIPLHELQVNVERIEWISNLMSHAGGEHIEGGEPLDLDSLFGFASRLGDVPQNDRQTDRLAALRIFFIGHQRHDIKI